jgi:hypothetical protein
MFHRAHVIMFDFSGVYSTVNLSWSPLATAQSSIFSGGNKSKVPSLSLHITSTISALVRFGYSASETRGGRPGDTAGRTRTRLGEGHRAAISLCILWLHRWLFAFNRGSLHDVALQN